MRNYIKTNPMFLSVVAMLLPTLVMAHTGVGATSGLVAGLYHPIGGLDHVLAMVAVGILAAQIGGYALWAIPSAFLGVMALGGVMAHSGIYMPWVETGILWSILVLGMLILSEFRFSLSTSVIIVGFCALFHGYAHGSELPIGSGAVTYSMGFILATALLHASGIVAAMLLQKLNFANLYRLLGGAVVLSGMYLAAF